MFIIDHAIALLIYYDSFVGEAKKIWSFFKRLFLLFQSVVMFLEQYENHCVNKKNIVLKYLYLFVSQQEDYKYQSV